MLYNITHRTGAGSVSLASVAVVVLVGFAGSNKMTQLTLPHLWHHDIQNKGIQHSDTQHNVLIFDIKHKRQSQ
jgi:hypothetical protein